ncbi:hypothetical protein GCM10023093_17850 [Nemorincola caseinilytica]|uniref:BioF2-like acetyltransferase domain-containing protein n=1 Tax=Nemorincola caseinilytica TaxID=2054315 RepID=A0ABP8NDI5_9BACT
MGIEVRTDILPPPQHEGDIFNTMAFFGLYKKPGSVFLLLYRDGGYAGHVHFTDIAPHVFKSPYRGTYGGFEFAEGTPPDVAKECIEAACSYLQQQHGARKIIITTAPFAHSVHRSSWHYHLYMNCGFAVQGQEINHALVVDDTPILEKMMRNNRKRYNKCQREGFGFVQVTEPEQFADIYNVIHANRDARGYTVSMTLEQIMDLYRVFPQRLFFFKVTGGEGDAASAICIRLSSSVLYVFYWGHTPGFEQYSPVAYLAGGIYDFARQQGYSLIDAGTSSLDGVPNFGLAAFKENLGFTASLKLTYSKTYE